MKTKKQLKSMLEGWADKCGLKDAPEIEDLEKAYADFVNILKKFKVRKRRTK